MSNLWAGSFGDAYTRRNAETRNVQQRGALWEAILPPDCESILEVGANIGQNLEAIARVSTADLFACEPNRLARDELQALELGHVTDDYADALSFRTNSMDLVLTMGVLIHISPAKLLPSMKEIHRCARRWIICAEYFAPSEEMVPYRGLKDALWRRDYGSLWLDNFPDLHCLASMFAWKRTTGLDNLVFWVLEKGRKAH